jgi:GNAT superfamily N-acetyltransferase
MEIRPITADAARAVRLPILRPGHPPHTAMFPEDDNPRTVHLGAFDGEQLVAVATFFPEACAARPGVPAYRLRGMATLRGWQGRGIGRALLAAGTELAEDAGARALWCHARSTARGFYEKLGFETEGEEFELPVSGRHYVMIKDLREPS